MNRLSDLKRMIFLLLAGILSACSHDELTETRPAENGEPLVLTAVMADATTGTRATPDNSWTGTETIIVEVIDDYDDTTAPDWTQAKRGIYTAGTDGKLTFVSGEQSSWLSDNETKLVRAWHYGDNSNEHPDSWSVQSDQRTGDDYAKSDLLFAQETVSERQEIALNFYHQVAKVVVHVRNVGPVYGSSNVSVTIGEFPSFDQCDYRRIPVVRYCYERHGEYGQHERKLSQLDTGRQRVHHTSQPRSTISCIQRNRNFPRQFRRTCHSANSGCIWILACHLGGGCQLSLSFTNRHYLESR